ncbi:MAG: RNase P subunit p30 family protein [archaeon]
MKDINLFKTKDSVYLKLVRSKSEVSKEDSCDGFLIDSSEKEARRIIESLKGTGKLIAIVGGDDAFNRRAIESLKIDYLISPEAKNRGDNLKQRDSGINHVVAKEAVKKGVAIIIDFNEIQKLKGKEKALRLGRLIQNVKICRKAGCDIKIASLGFNQKSLVDERGRKSFGVSLGMSSVQATKSVQF